MSGNTISIAWWNLENLFEPDKHPNWKAWDQQLYNEKLTNLAQGIRSLEVDGQGPDILGVCEVENERILTELINDHLPDLGYKVVHHDSAGLRGIDVAFIYRNSLVDCIENETVSHTIVKRIKTRDIFEIRLKVKEDESELILLANHWPSRMGGVYESEPFRIMSAEQCSVITQNILHEDPEARMVIMGDFNDDPFNRSIREYLHAIRDRKRVVSRRTKRPYLLNCMWSLIGESNTGSYYNTLGETPWFYFDQIMVTPGLLRNDTGLKLDEDSISIHNPKWMRRSNGAPKFFRKYRGKIIKGYSDHFPVTCRLKIQ